MCDCEAKEAPEAQVVREVERVVEELTSTMVNIERIRSDAELWRLWWTLAAVVVCCVATAGTVAAVSLHR